MTRTARVFYDLNGLQSRHYCESSSAEWRARGERAHARGIDRPAGDPVRSHRAAAQHGRAAIARGSAPGFVGRKIRTVAPLAFDFRPDTAIRTNRSPLSGVADR